MTLKIDCQLRGLDFREVPDHARLMEKMGFDAAWTFEAGQDAFTPLTLAAARKLASDINHRRAIGQDIERSSATFAGAAVAFVKQHGMKSVRRWEEQAQLLGVDKELNLIPGGLAERWRGYKGNWC